MLDSINTMLTDLLGPFGPLLALGFLGVMMILLALPAMFKPQKDPLDRLKAPRAEATPTKVDKLRTNQGKDKLEKYSHFLEPQDEKEYSSVRLKLLQAGYKTKNAVRIYHFSQFALGLGGLAIGSIYALWQNSIGDPTTTNLMLYSMGPGVAGYMLPKYWVNRRQQPVRLKSPTVFPTAST